LNIRLPTACMICGERVGDTEDIVRFPAFLPLEHELGAFSEATVHIACLQADPRSTDVLALLQRYRAIWATRPVGLTDPDEIQAWGREAFKDFP
jgi:hypothetical protein